MYKIIHDEEELKFFFDNILYPLEKDEVFFVSLSARNKYLTAEERIELSLGRTEMFERRIIREYNFEKFLRTIRKFEANEGAYTTKTNKMIPSKSIICYMNVNPSSVLKSYIEFNKIMTEYLYEMTTTHDKSNVLMRISKADVLLMNCLQKNRGRKIYMDLDLDIPKERFDIVETMIKDFESHNVKYFVIDTKSGYHILLKKDTVKYNFNEIINRVSKDNPAFEIILNKNEMIPLPGTLQGGHKVTVLDF